MRDRPIIFGGLIVFLGLATFPFWYNVASGKTSRGPDIKLPAQKKECVAPTGYMRSSHMDLLVNWRDQVVRQNVRRFTAFSGRSYAISLTGTCLKQCHTSKAEFCDRCHDYAGAGTLYCWECHNEPRPAPGPLTGSEVAQLSRGAGNLARERAFQRVQRRLKSRRQPRTAAPQGVLQ